MRLVEFGVGKRNKPKIYASEEDLVRFGKRLKKLLLKPTYDTSTNHNKHLFINGVIMATGFFRDCKGTVLYPLDYLENFEDPVMALNTNSRVFCQKPTIIEQQKQNLLVWFGDEKPRFVTLPKVPKNAWLIKAKPPTWIQVCHNGYFITNGVLWCDEMIEETGEVVEKFGVFRDDNKWLVMLPPTKLSHCYLGGLYVAEKNRFIQEAVYEEASPEVVFQGGAHWIRDKGDKYIEVDSFSEVPKSDLEMVRAEFDDNVYYVPRRRLYSFPDIGWLLGEVL